MLSLHVSSHVRLQACKCMCRSLFVRTGRALMKQASFDTPRGHRRLAHRASDVMWLNAALDTASACVQDIHVAVRRPPSVAQRTWEGWSREAQLTYVNALNSGDCPGALCRRSVAAVLVLIMAQVQ